MKAIESWLGFKFKNFQCTVREVFEVESRLFSLCMENASLHLSALYFLDVHMYIMTSCWTHHPTNWLFLIQWRK